MRSDLLNLWADTGVESVWMTCSILQRVPVPTNCRQSELALAILHHDGEQVRQVAQKQGQTEPRHNWAHYDSCSEKQWTRVKFWSPKAKEAPGA